HPRDVEGYGQQQSRGRPSARTRCENDSQQAQGVRSRRVRRMRLSTRFGLGAALALLPLLAVSVYSVDRMQELARANERLTERQLIGLQIGLGVVSRLERLEEYWRKYTVSLDAGYVRKF